MHTGGPDVLGVEPLPIALRDRIEAGTYVRIAAHGWREARVLGVAPVTYTATDRSYPVAAAMELALGTDGRDALRLRGAAVGGPVLDPDSGAVIAVVGTALRGGHTAAGFAVPLVGVSTVEPLSALLRRNATTVPGYGRDLNLAGALQLAAMSITAAGGPGAWPDPVERPARRPGPVGRRGGRRARRGAAATYGPLSAPHATAEADRALLRRSALALLAHPADVDLHAAGPVRAYVDSHPEGGAHVAEYIDRRMEHGPAARAMLLPLVSGLLRDRPAPAPRLPGRCAPSCWRCCWSSSRVPTVTRSCSTHRSVQRRPDPLGVRRSVPERWSTAPGCCSSAPRKERPASTGGWSNWPVKCPDSPSWSPDGWPMRRRSGRPSSAPVRGGPWRPCPPR